MESRVGANDYRIKMGSKTKTYQVNMLKKYIAREPEVDAVHTSNKDDASIAVALLIYQDTDPELGKVPDLDVYHQKEGVRDVILSTLQICIKSFNLIRKINYNVIISFNQGSAF